MEFRRENLGFRFQGSTSAAMVAWLQQDATESGLLAGTSPVPSGRGSLSYTLGQTVESQENTTTPGCPGRRQLYSAIHSSAQPLRDLSGRCKTTPPVFWQTSCRICQTDQSLSQSGLLGGVYLCQSHWSEKKSFKLGSRQNE